VSAITVRSPHPSITMSGSIASEIGQNAPIPSAAMELVLNVRRTANVLDVWLERVLAPAELRVAEFNILRILRGAGAKGHPRPEVERRMVSGADQLTVSVHRLKARGLVAGVFELRITPAGLALLAELDDTVARAILGLGTGIPEARLRAAIEVLEEVRRRTGA